jgi:hypothetical protein
MGQLNVDAALLFLDDGTDGHAGHPWTLPTFQKFLTESGKRTNPMPLDEVPYKGLWPDDDRDLPAKLSRGDSDNLRSWWLKHRGTSTDPASTKELVQATTIHKGSDNTAHPGLLAYRKWWAGVAPKTGLNALVDELFAEHRCGPMDMIKADCKVSVRSG